MKTSFTTKEQKFIEIFDNYINGNISDFKTSIRKLSKVDLLRCIDITIQNYGHIMEDNEGHKIGDIVKIFLIHLQ